MAMCFMAYLIKLIVSCIAIRLTAMTESNGRKKAEFSNKRTQLWCAI